MKDLDDRHHPTGAEVRRDILVGKVTPKGETELTAEECLPDYLWRKGPGGADTSLRVPHGEAGKIARQSIFPG